jgi:dCTP deaminase
MILSGRDIKSYIDAGLLKFWPQLRPDQFQQNGVDMILGQQVGRLTHGHVDTDPCSMFGRGEVYLLHTAERIRVPNDLMAFVELRSTWARRGLILPPTVVDAGFDGELTLEVFCAGPGFPIPKGERFAHLIFAKLASPAEPYRGKYQGQRGVTPAKED